MKLGIVGLPNVGKSTLFNSLTKAGAESANYPFCTIDPNVGVVTVPDERLKLLGDFYHSKKVTPAVIEFVDIAGLVKGASKGEGLGNQFLANIREVDAIVHVVRCFEDSNVIHVDGSIDPIRDIETINLELIFSDLEILERRIAKVTKTARMDKEAAKELDFLQKVKTHLEDGKMAITMEMENEDEEAWMSTYNLLTWKPVIYAANVAEGDLADDGESNSHVQAVRKYAAEQNSEIFVICAEIEEEISELDDDEKKMFLEDLGLTESKGEGLGNQFLANIREVDAIVHVVRCFEDSNVIHVDGSIDPIRDIETINLELIFSDLEILERRIAKVTKTARMDKEAAKELDFLQKVKTHLEDGKMAITMEMENEDEEAWMSTYNLLTWKPVIYAANVAEGDLADDGESNSHVQAVRKYAAEQNSEIFVICAEIEEEISELDDDEKKMFLEDLGLTESGLEKLVKASYHLLGLMSFLTSGEDETRAWTIKIGTKAPQAAGKIHTDFERGFIKAEVVNYQDLLDCGSYAGAREKGLVRMEGKEYVVQDGDVILFRFNV